jgi:four helix bundle protein
LHCEYLGSWRRCQRLWPARQIGGQLVRSGTSVGANYRAACRARSKVEFIAKIGIVEEEADESAFWMELIIESELISLHLVNPLLDEANELAKIMASSRKSASESLKTQRRIINWQSEIGNDPWLNTTKDLF